MTVHPAMEHTSCSEEDHDSPPLSVNAGAGGSWLHWENEISSISGLNIDSTSELNGLVEDKEMAARAVALVVNSTRKGIVPLCADIASLLRAKRSLEKKVYLMKRDLEAVRSSTSVSFRTSHSTSPTLPLVDVHGAGHTTQDPSRPCSRCSQCSVTGAAASLGHHNHHNHQHHHHTTHHTTIHNNSTSTSIATTTTPPTTTPSASPSTAAAATAVTPASPSSSSSTTTTTIPKQPQQQQQQHLSSPCVSRPASTRTSPRPGRSQGHHSSRGFGSRKNSLPEMTSEPSTEVKRVSPKVSKGTQCACVMAVVGDTPLEEQFLETVRLNSKLSEELGSARKEIEFLKGRLKELEMKQLARDCFSHEQSYRLQQSRDGGKDTTTGAVTSDPLAALTSCRHTASRHRRPKSNGLSAAHQRVSAPPGSLLYAEPLYGCKCSACDEAMGGDIHSALSAALNQELQKFPISGDVLVQLGDHVVIKGEKTGRIRYIGHLDKIGQPNMVFVGLELDAPVGHHDGFFNNKRYFFCQKDHGLFVPLHDMVCKVCDKNDEPCPDSADVTNIMATGSDVEGTSGPHAQESVVDMGVEDDDVGVDDNAMTSLRSPLPPPPTAPNPTTLYSSDYVIDHHHPDYGSVEMTSLTSHHRRQSHVTMSSSNGIDNDDNNTTTTTNDDDDDHCQSRKSSSQRNSVEDYV